MFSNNISHSEHTNEHTHEHTNEQFDKLQNEINELKDFTVKTTEEIVNTTNNKINEAKNSLLESRNQIITETKNELEKKLFELDSFKNNIQNEINYKKVAIISLKTDSYANTNVITNQEKTEDNSKQDEVWKRTQVRNLSDIESLNKNAEELELNSNKSKLITSLTGNNGSESPEYQTGRYTLYFDDFKSITFTTGFRSDYGFGEYKYVGIVHGMGKYKIAEISWLSLASGEDGTDNWNIKIFEPKDDIIDDEITMKLKTESYANSNIITNQSSSADDDAESVWRRTQVRNISDIENVDIESLKSKLLTSLTGNNGSTSPEYQTGRYVLYFDDFTSITFTTGFNSNYGFGTYTYTGIIHGMGDYKTAKISWTSLASGVGGTDNWEITLSKSINDLESKLRASPVITLKTESYANSNLITNQESDENNSSDKIWKKTQVRDVADVKDVNDDLDETFDSKKAKLITSLTGNNGSNSPEYQTGRYVIYLDDFTSITFTTGFRSDYGFGVYKYIGIVHGLEKYKFAEISWTSLASGVAGTDEWEIKLIRSEDNNSIAEIMLQTESYANSNIITNQFINENNDNQSVWTKTQVRDISLITSVNKNAKELKLASPEAKLLTSLTGNNGSKSPEYQTGRYTLYFDDFKSITFTTGFKSNYGFGTYNYTGTVHGLKGYNTAEISWTSLASGVEGKDDWKIRLS